MNHLADFNISQLRHRQHSVNTNECNIVINNHMKSSPPDWAYPHIQEWDYVPSEARNFNPVNNIDTSIPTGYTQAGGINTQVDTWDAFLYQTIAQTLSHILKTNNKLFIRNAIDLSGKTIVDIVGLVAIIGITCKVPM